MRWWSSRDGERKSHNEESLEESVLDEETAGKGVSNEGRSTGKKGDKRKESNRWGDRGKGRGMRIEEM